jgi:tRNA modification GTPase
MTAVADGDGVERTGMAILDQGTIVAVATPEGRGGLAVVRLSGPDALAVARRVAPDAGLDDPVDSHRARLATLHWPADADASGAGQAPGQALDQALVLPMLAPGTYTGEDVVEFFCHGGVMPARLVVAACRAAGAQAAGPGEFTRRAFLNGRLSLDQAEAVADLIDAEHAVGARASLAQLRGALDERLAGIEQPLRDLLARLEGSLEFAEHEDASPPIDEVRAALAAAAHAVDALLSLAPAGRRLREGVQVVLAGPPNAGKSSLFNALLDRDRALVDAAPGTTRDVVTDTLELDGLLFVIHDTAGLHDAAEGVEARGVTRAREVVAAADLLLRVSPLPEPADAAPAAAPDACVVIDVRTKSDLVDPAPGGDAIVTSSVTGYGIDELRGAMLDAARRDGLGEAAAAGVVLNQRHQDRLRSCRDHLARVAAAQDDGAGDEVIASLLAVALQDLGAISGRVFTEQMLGQVFNRFCVGK